MRIGELARKAQVNIQTVRYYERRRLVKTPVRTPGGYRSYEEGDLEQLRFIKWCQRLGFTLKEIRGLLPLHAAVAERRSSKGGKPLRGLRELLASKQADIEGKIAELRRLRNQLAAAIKALSPRGEPACPAAKLNRKLGGPPSSQERQAGGMTQKIP